MTKPQRCLWALNNIEGILRLESESVALAYLDPPFNSGRSYETVISATQTVGKEKRHTFADAWRWTDKTERTLKSLGEFLPRTAAEFVQSLAKTLGPSPTTAYLIEMAPRLAELHRVLRCDGSLYVHCDHRQATT